MAKETSNRQVIRFCVGLYRAADFLLLKPMLSIIQRRLGDHCDEKLKWLSTRGDLQVDHTVLLWARDIVNGIEEAYRWNTEPIKKTLMEFVWVGRFRLLGTPWPGMDDLNNNSIFIKDMLHHCALRPWQEDSAWAPDPLGVNVAKGWRSTCVRCNTKLAMVSQGAPTAAADADGQVEDPFNKTAENLVLREWCKKCAAMDMIPWREKRS